MLNKITVHYYNGANQRQIFYDKKNSGFFFFGSHFPVTLQQVSI